MTAARRRGLELIERLLDALADPARRERAAAAAQPSAGGAPARWSCVPGDTRASTGSTGRPARYLLVTVPPWQLERMLSLRDPVAEYLARLCLRPTRRASVWMDSRLPRRSEAEPR